MMVHRPSPAMLVAVTALVVSLGGNSYAAVKLAKNSVNSQAIKDGQVKRADLARNAVGTDQVAAGSLLANDFEAGQLPAGPQGPKGDKGEKGLTSFAVRANAGQQPDAVTAPCNPGEVAVSGGAHSFDGVSATSTDVPTEVDGRRVRPNGVLVGADAVTVSLDVQPVDADGQTPAMRLFVGVRP